MRNISISGKELDLLAVWDDMEALNLELRKIHKNAKTHKKRIKGGSRSIKRNEFHPDLL